MIKIIAFIIICFLPLAGLQAAEEPNKTKVIQFSGELLNAAQNGDPVSQRKLGQCYLLGKGIEKNNEEGIQWLQKSAENGNLDALVLLFGIYFKGECGTAKNTEKGVSYLIKVADKKTTDQKTQETIAGFQAILGNLYETGNGVKKDAKEALKWLEKSASAGNALGEAALGTMYFDGRGIPKDTSRAFELFQRSASKNDIRGMTGLAVCYYKGEGTAQDYKKAFHLLEKITQEDAKQVGALKMLGICYYYGHGTEKNEREAKRYLMLAKTEGADDVDAFIMDIDLNQSNAEQKKICGEYVVKGTNQNATTYEGRATISKPGDLFEIDWKISKGKDVPVESYTGIGFVESNNACFYFTGKFQGVVCYCVNKENNMLQGRWVGRDEGTKKYLSGTEQLLKATHR